MSGYSVIKPKGLFTVCDRKRFFFHPMVIKVLKFCLGVSQLYHCLRLWRRNRAMWMSLKILEFAKREWALNFECCLRPVLFLTAFHWLCNHLVVRKSPLLIVLLHAENSSLNFWLFFHHCRVSASRVLLAKFNSFLENWTNPNPLHVHVVRSLLSKGIAFISISGISCRFCKNKNTYCMMQIMLPCKVTCYEYKISSKLYHLLCILV